MHKASQGDIVETRRILERWEGQYVLAGPHSDGSAVARFSAPGAQKEVLDALGGGVRGQYRLSRVGANTGNTSPPHAPCFDHSDMNMSTSCFHVCTMYFHLSFYCWGGRHIPTLPVLCTPAGASSAAAARGPAGSQAPAAPAAAANSSGSSRQQGTVGIPEVFAHLFPAHSAAGVSTAQAGVPGRAVMTPRMQQSTPTACCLCDTLYCCRQSRLQETIMLPRIHRCGPLLRI